MLLLARPFGKDHVDKAKFVHIERPLHKKVLERPSLSLFNGLDDARIRRREGGDLHKVAAEYRHPPRKRDTKISSPFPGHRRRDRARSHGDGKFGAVRGKERYDRASGRHPIHRPYHKVAVEKDLHSRENSVVASDIDDERVVRGASGGRYDPREEDVALFGAPESAFEVFILPAEPVARVRLKRRRVERILQSDISYGAPQGPVHDPADQKGRAIVKER